MLRGIVLTGGPGSGKTTIGRLLAKKHADTLVLVPEAATQVYHRLQTRWNKLDDDGRRNVQRLIYQLQLEQEQRMREARPGKRLLLDRGTVDGAAYWPDGAEDYWRAMGTTYEAEVARYEAAIWLECPVRIGRYNPSSNPVRFEDAEGAIRCGESLRQLWQVHPRFRVLKARREIEQKLAEVERIVSIWL